ncbi:unnamed protein product [Mycena citricolor]|uniref:Uncharacterized protein n=1 Tax=Mycena citricolor TaxID=2018698 RepID=A0AAD2H2I0_9AGAR|nr:unnamed protein product [Mycena citricolor]
MYNSLNHNFLRNSRSHWPSSEERVGSTGCVPHGPFGGDRRSRHVHSHEIRHGMRFHGKHTTAKWCEYAKTNARRSSHDVSSSRPSRRLCVVQQYGSKETNKIGAQRSAYLEQH